MKTIVPHDALEQETLDALIEEFITRDGAVHGHHDRSIDGQIASVKAQLRARMVVIIFDEVSETCTIVARETLRSLGAEESGSSQKHAQTPASERTREDPDSSLERLQ